MVEGRPPPAVFDFCSNPPPDRRHPERSRSSGRVRDLLSPLFSFLNIVRQKQKGCPIPRVLCEEWEPQTRSAPFLMLTLLVTWSVWNGHSCPLRLDVEGFVSGYAF